MLFLKLLDLKIILIIIAGCAAIIGGMILTLDAVFEAPPAIVQQQVTQQPRPRTVYTPQGKKIRDWRLK